MSLSSIFGGLKNFANPWLLLAVVLLVAGAGATGWHYGATVEAGKQAKTELLIQQAGDAAQKAAATEISKIKVVNQTNQTRLEREIVHVPDFSQCHTGPDAVRVLNDALTNKAGAQPTGHSVVPDANGVVR